MRITSIILFHLFFLVRGMLYPGPVKVPENNGCRYLVNYNQKDYNFAEQNWVILQDRRGIIYAANQAGVLECDGVDWGGVVLPRTRSMDMDNSGTIYVGGKDEIGFIDTKADSSLTYVSLLRYLDENELDFGWVMSTHATEAGIYFRTSKFLFRFQPEARELKTWRPLIGESGFAGSFVCRGKLFIRYKNIGLMQMVDDKLESVPGGDLFARRGIYAMFPFNERELVIGTQDGFYLFNGRIMVPFPTEVDDYIKEKQLSHGIRLESSPGLFALSTLRGGLIIIDSRGRLREIFTRDRGLQDDNVKFVFEDSQGNLWLALEKGITKIEYASPFSFYNAEFSGLQGIVLAVVRHGSPGVLHVGTTRGLFILKPGGKFQPVPGITGECFALLSTGGSLLTATNSGLFYFAAKSNNPRPREIIAAPTYFLQTSRQMPGYIWARTNNGLFSLFRQKEDWVVTHRFENISRKNATIVEDERGNLWLGTLTGTNEVLLKIEFPVDNREKKEKGFKKIYYNKSQGPPDEEIRVFRAAGHVIVSTKKGIYRFDEKENRFIPDLTFGKLFADGSRRALYIVEDQNRHIWLHTFRGRFENFRAVPQPKGTYLIEKKPFLRLPNEQINIIYPDPGRSITWFGGNEGLVCFDNRVKKTTVLPFRALVRKVESIVDRSVIFGGNRTGDSFPMPHIEYKDRSIRFRYAAPFFDDESATSYQVYLEGNEKSWGEWTEERRREYPNLDAGYYTFHVRARNVYKNKSREDSFRFRVLPPWYRTWWAYFIYALFSVLCIYLFVKWRSRKLLREKQQLEQVVKDRTKEVYEKNLLLEEQAGKLKELDKAKSRFFANISHEFRTPLTLIMGPLEQVLSGCRDRKQVEDINIALRNSRRLLALINQLLDLSKLESGRMQLQVCRQDMIPFLKGLVGSFESTARQKNLDLSSHAAEEEALLYFDTEKMEKIITNLAANAVKFTPAGGKITVTAAAHTVPDENYPGGYFEIRVGDSGIGIPEKQLPYIFDRFYQAGLTPSRKQRSEGTGIGLALVKELIILHHGEIAVNSREGKGSEFTIRLPMGKRHLKPEEIILDGESLSRTGEMIGPETPAPYLESEVGAGEEEHETEPGEKEKEVILLVEDNPDVRKYIRDPLLSAYTVIEAADGKEGIDRANEIIPDLIISDIMMPEVDGYQLCSVLKKDIRTSHIPIILLTARASEESIIAGLETGADDYITKPFNTHILLTRIKNLIDLRRQLQEKIQREMVLQPTEIAVSSMDREFMKELKEALEKNLSDPDFGVDELTAALYMGRATLNRKIKAITGESTRRFIQSYRLKRAAQLLKANFGNVTEVSFEVGFASSGYFTKCFKKKFHQLPLAFQSAESR